MSDVLRPVGIAECVLQQLIFVRFRGHIAFVGELLRLEVVACKKAGDVRHDDHVGELAVTRFVGFDADGKRTLQNANDGIEVAFAHRFEREGDGDDDVCAHGSDVGCWQVLEDGSVYKLVAIKLKGAEYSWNRSRGADGVLQ